MSESQKSAVRIDLSKGQVELQGSEEFLRQALADVRDIIANSHQGQFSANQPPLPPSSSIKPTPPAIIDMTGERVAKRRKVASAMYVAPIPFDLNGNGVSLPDFFKAKKVPKNHEKLITVIAFWMDRYGGIKSILPGHLMYAYQELGLEKPGNLYASLTNARSRSRTVVSGAEPGSIRVNHSGENYVLGLPGSGPTTAT
jgi:hypothetical protein